MDYNETLLESIQLLIDSSLANQPRDEIVRCRITDIAERDKGRYKVTSSDLVIFDAYSEKTTYRLDEEVNVLIPKNDQDKRQILGRYISQQVQPIAYVSSEEKLVSIENIYSQSDVTGIVANNSTEMMLIGEITQGLEKSHLFNTFHIQADFKTLLSQYANTMRSGKYGLLALCYFVADDESALPAAVFELSSDHMFGNPYNYMTYFRQEYIFNYDISIPFERIDLYLFQDNNFKYFDGRKLESVPTSDMPPNILVSNIKMSFAYDVSNYDNQTVEIKTSDILEYTNSDLYKNINLIWYNKTPENKYLGFSDGDFAEAAVKPVGYIESAQKFTQNEDEEPKGFYYLQDMGYTQFFSEEKYEPGDKVYYTKKTYSDNEKSTVDGMAPERPQYKIEWLVDNEEGVLTPQAEMSQVFELECRKDLTNTEVQAIIYRDGVAHKSNILKFENKSIYDNNVSNLDISLDFKHLDNSLPAYAFYGQNNQLLDSTERFKRRRVQAIWNSSAGNVSSSYWKDATITWSIPKNATMILPSPSQEMDEMEDKYVLSKEIETGADEEFQFEYLINNIFYANYINNQIECTLSLPGDRGSARGALPLAFSSFGTSGTSYTFIISPQNNKFAWTDLGDITAFGATLVDKNGEILNIDSIKWQYPYEKITAKEDKTCEITLSELNEYTVLEASVEQEWGGKTIALTATYPIVFSNGGQYYAQAPSEILYDSFGSLMNINFAPLKLFNLNSQEEIKDIIWNIYYTDPDNKLFAPVISYNDRTEEYTIVPPVMYVNNAPKVILRAKAQDNTILWQTPLVLTQYKYGSSILNDWNGELNIDNNNNYILSSMLGAGKKNNDNTFSGVLMGEVGNQLGTSSEGIGLYGYDHGAQAFGFKENGTAFIGKSGTGRIQFDGNEGIIASASWYDAGGLREEGPENDHGVRIDLRDGNLRLDKGDEFLHFDDDGLKIKVHSLEITSDLKGVNLFKNPTPENREENFGWQYSNDEKAQFTDIESYSAIALHGTRKLYQEVKELTPGKAYSITFDKYNQQEIIESNDFSIQIIDCDTQEMQEAEFNQDNNYFTFISPGKDIIIQFEDKNYKYIPTYNDWNKKEETIKLEIGKYNGVNWYGVTNNATDYNDLQSIYYELGKLNTLTPSFAFRVHRTTKITLSLYNRNDINIPIASLDKEILTPSKEQNLLFDFNLSEENIDLKETQFTLGIKGALDTNNNNKRWWFLPIGVLLNHFKLELGETPTPYYYDISNYMIDKISSDQQGIYLDQNQFFINASTIATGALMSQNWINSGGSYGVQNNKQEFLSHGSQGLAIDLVNGEISTNSLIISNSDYTSVGITRDQGFMVKKQDGLPIIQLGPTAQFLQSSDYIEDKASSDTYTVLYYYKAANYYGTDSLRIRSHPSNSNPLGYITKNSTGIKFEVDSNGDFITLPGYSNWWYVRDYEYNGQKLNGYVYRYGTTSSDVFKDISDRQSKYAQDGSTASIQGCKIDLTNGKITIGDGEKYIVIDAGGLHENGET